jgi:hypothetical protein
MKLSFAAAFLTIGIITPSLSADVGVSVSVGQPGFYGHIDIGDYPYPQPQVIYRQPRIVERSYYVDREPIYLRVPPGHSKNWRKHCHQYNACAERVFFVQDNWYNREYAPRYREQHRDHGDDRWNQRDDRHEDKREERHSENRERH